LTAVRSSRRGFNCPRRRDVHVRRQRACDTGPNPDLRVDRVDSPQPEGEPSIARTTASTHAVEAVCADEMCTQRGSEAGVLGQRRTGGTGTAGRLSKGTRSREMIFCSRSSALAVIIRSGRVRRWRSTMTMAERVYGAPAAAQSSHYAHFLPFSAGRSGNYFRGHYRKMALTLGIVPAELPYHLNRLNSRNTLRTNMPWFAVDVDCLHAAGVAAGHRRREIRRHSRV